MNDSQMPFSQHFSELNKNPRWRIKLILSILIIILSTIINSYLINYNELYKASGLNGEQLEKAKMIGRIGGIISSSLVAIIEIGITFFIFSLISKLMKSDTNKRTTFSATLSYTLITATISLIVILIQWITDLSPTDYSITSLNIFDKGNKTLGAFNFQTLIGAYVFGIMLYKTYKISKLSSIIWSISYLIILIGFSLLR